MKTLRDTNNNNSNTTQQHFSSNTSSSSSTNTRQNFISSNESVHQNSMENHRFQPQTTWRAHSGIVLSRLCCSLSPRPIN
jgi:hypothetical protein